MLIVMKSCFHGMVLEIQGSISPLIRSIFEFGDSDRKPTKICYHEKKILWKGNNYQLAGWFEIEEFYCKTG